MRRTILCVALLLAGAALFVGLSADARDPAPLRVAQKPKTPAPVPVQPVPAPAGKAPAGKAPAATQPAAGTPAAKQPAAQPTTREAAKLVATDPADAEQLAIEASAAAFVKSYNAHDAKAVAACFAEKAQFINEDGELVDGRAAIEKSFAEKFAEEPEAWITLDIDSIRLLTPNVAIEEGTARSAASPDATHGTSNYVAIHIKKDGKWLVGSVRDYETDDASLTPHDRLQELAWMVGSWVDEEPDSLVMMSCDWSPDGNYLLQEYEVLIEGQIAVTGSARIGWDPLARQLRSWNFSSDGGFSEALWVRGDDGWISKSQGTTANGENSTATHSWRSIDNDTMAWSSYDRTVGGEAAPDVEEVTVRRSPPPVETEK